MMAPSPDRLVAQCAAGDEDAWARLYRSHAPKVALFLQRILGPDRDLDDLVQAVFVELLSSIRRYQGRGAVTTWLYGIASNVAARHRRFEFRRRRRQQAYAEWLASAQLVSVEPSTSTEERQLLKVIGELVGGMDMKFRLVWVMREWEGLDTDEVAEALDLPAGTIRSRLSRAREALAQGLRAAGFESSALALRPALAVDVVARIAPGRGHGAGIGARPSDVRRTKEDDHEER
jgi:RNA polymerase sigma-70 factor (ECF subfamily)